MNDIREIVRANRLLETYGKLLTKSQKEIMEYYYAFNLSLAEISEQKKISRAAVADSLKTSLHKLEELESILEIIKTRDRLVDELSDIEKNDKDPKVAKIIERLKRNI